MLDTDRGNDPVLGRATQTGFLDSRHYLRVLRRCRRRLDQA
jgi:hypothetical protein